MTLVRKNFIEHFSQVDIGGNYKIKRKNTLALPAPFEGSNNSERYFASLAFNSPKWYSVAENKKNKYTECYQN